MIIEHGGDVLKFAGDALIVGFFDLEGKETLSELTLRAVNCGLDIQEKLKEFDAGEIKLSIHTSVGAGRVTTHHLGGIDNHFEYCATGNIFKQLEFPLSQSKSGEVCVSSEAWPVLEQFCDGLGILVFVLFHFF